MRTLPLPEATDYLFAGESRLVVVSGVKAKTVHTVEAEGTELVRATTFGSTVLDRPLALAAGDLVCAIGGELVAVSLGGDEPRVLVPAARTPRHKGGAGRIEAAAPAGGGVVLAWSFEDEETVEWSWLDPASGELRRLSKTTAATKTVLSRWCSGNSRTATWLEHPIDTERPATSAYELVRWHAEGDEIERSPLSLRDIRVLVVSGGVTYLGAASKTPGESDACIYACYGSAVELVAKLPPGAVEGITAVEERCFAIHSSGTFGQDQLFGFGPGSDDPVTALCRADKGYRFRDLTARDGEVYWLDRLNMMAPPRKPRQPPDRLSALERVTAVPPSR
jgi:hypothetical protein